MSPNIWGPSIWTLFHALAEQIKEDRFQETRTYLFQFITKICWHLPCPDCTMHAKQYLDRVNIYNVRTKEQFRHFLWNFHNNVNKRKNKSLYDPSMLSTKYGQISLIQCFNNFINVYKTTGNMRLMTDGFQRQFIVSGLRKWLTRNLGNFERIPYASPNSPNPNPKSQTTTVS